MGNCRSPTIYRCKNMKTFRDYLNEASMSQAEKFEAQTHFKSDLKPRDGGEKTFTLNDDSYIIIRHNQKRIEHIDKNNDVISVYLTPKQALKAFKMGNQDEVSQSRVKNLNESAKEESFDFDKVPDAKLIKVGETFTINKHSYRVTSWSKTVIKAVKV